MRDLKALALGLFLTLASITGAFAQCGTTAPANKFCGNDTGSAALANWKTIPAGALTPIAGGTVLGNPTGALAVPIATTAPVLGIPGTSTGQIGLAGLTSGTAVLRAQAVAGSAVSLLPTAAGTLVGTATLPLTINATTGLLALPGLAGGVLAGSGPAFTITPVLGVPTASQGTLGFAGATSGTATITAQATAGTPSLVLPNTSGTFAVNASSPLVLSATTGALTCPTCATTTNGGALTGTAPITVSAAGVIALTTPLALNFGGSNANLTASNGGIVWSNATQLQILAGTATARLPVLSGATATPQYGAYTLPASVTSGGIPFFSSTTAEGSSALLTANAIMLGGGVGVAPATLGSLGTTTTVLHGNAAGAPTFGAVVSADLNITTTSCTNQFVTAISAGGVGTCTTDTLASAQHANQGTTTTVLHGNAAGNPSFSAVAIGADVSGLGTGIAAALAINTGTAGAPALLGAAASFTTVTATTSVTSPLDIGGSGTTGTQKTFKTTTGAGTTDQFAWVGGNNGATTFATLGIGGLVVNTNTTIGINLGSSTANSFINIAGSSGSFGIGVIGTTAVMQGASGVSLMQFQVSGGAPTMSVEGGTFLSPAYQVKGTVPTGTTGTCTASSFVGGSTAGRFTDTAICAAAGTIILTALPAATTGYACSISDMTTSTAALRQTNFSTTSVTFTVTTPTVANDLFSYKCMGF